jgi:tetratricopeptide (TPR) repeat protein
MNKVQILITCGILVAFAAVVAWFFFPRSATAPHAVAPESSPVENNSATTSDSKSVATSSPSRVATVLPSIAKGDSVASWDFKGAYADNPELIAKANAEIARFSDLIGKGTYSDMELYVSIANQYELLGNGKQEYDYLGRAIMSDPTSGLPWHNLGVLMERLGALKTARVAYDRAVFLQPVFGEIQQP